MYDALPEQGHTPQATSSGQEDPLSTQIDKGIYMQAASEAYSSAAKGYRLLRLVDTLAFFGPIGMMLLLFPPWLAFPLALIPTVLMAVLRHAQCGNSTNIVADLVKRPLTLIYPQNFSFAGICEKQVSAASWYKVRSLLNVVLCLLPWALAVSGPNALCGTDAQCILSQWVDMCCAHDALSEDKCWTHKNMSSDISVLTDGVVADTAGDPAWTFPLPLLSVVNCKELAQVSLLMQRIYGAVLMTNFPVDCVMGEWTEWSACDGSGLMEHSRIVAVPNNKKGMPCNRSSLIDTAVCTSGTPDAAAGDRDCLWTAWSEWNRCSVSCDAGQRTRTRSIEETAQGAGSGCSGSRSQTGPCDTPSCAEALARPCLFGLWTEWSACTTACGGGQRTRDRSIITEARSSGEACSGSKSDLQSCNTQSCSETVDNRDCHWNPWSEWSQCSVSCGSGQRTRDRSVNQSTRGAGEDCSGSRSQYGPCSDVFDCVSNTDCMFSSWSAWSLCTGACGVVGQRDRERDIHSYGRGAGQGCAGSTSDSEPCHTHSCSEVIQSDRRDENSLVPDQNCSWEDWRAWSACTADCGGGTKTRNRAPPSGTGTCSPESKSELAPCNTQFCSYQEMLDMPSPAEQKRIGEITAKLQADIASVPDLHLYFIVVPRVRVYSMMYGGSVATLVTLSIVCIVVQFMFAWLSPHCGFAPYNASHNASRARAIQKAAPSVAQRGRDALRVAPLLWLGMFLFALDYATDIFQLYNFFVLGHIWFFTLQAMAVGISTIYHMRLAGSPLRLCVAIVQEAWCSHELGFKTATLRKLQKSEVELEAWVAALIALYALPYLSKTPWAFVTSLFSAISSFNVLSEFAVGEFDLGGIDFDDNDGLSSEE